MRGDECGVEIVALHERLTAVLTFENLEVVLGYFLPGEIGASIQENSLAGIVVKREVVRPGVRCEDAGTGDHPGVAADYAGGISAVGEVGWPGQSKGNQRQTYDQNRYPDRVAGQADSMLLGQSDKDGAH